MSTIQTTTFTPAAPLTRAAAPAAAPPVVADRVETGVTPVDPPVQRDRLVSLFMRLTQVPGASYEERAIADAIKAEVADIGFDGATVKEDGAGERIGGNAGNVIVTVPGNVPDAPGLIFSSHMDTVPLAVGCKPRLGDDGIIRTDGRTALGGDNRAGCAEILEAMREIKESNLPHGPIQLVFCVGEEEGLLGSEQLDPNDLQGQYGFVMDVFKANHIYLQDRHLLATGDRPSAADVDHAHRAASGLPTTPPDDLELDDREKELLAFTTSAMQNVGLQPQYYQLEWAGTDAISLRRHGVNALSLGAGESEPHTRRETVAVDDLVASTTLVRSIVAKAAQSAVSAPPSVTAATAAAVPGPLGALLSTI